MINRLKDYAFLVILIAFIAISIFCYFLNKHLQHVKNDRDDYKAISQETFKSYKDKDGKSHGTVESITLNSEKLFKEQVAHDEYFLNALDTKLKKLEGYRFQSSKSDYFIHTRVRDTLIGDTVAIKIFEQTDPKGYYTFKGEIKGDSLTASLKSLDTLVTGISRGKCENRILWGLIGVSKRPMVVETVNKNPFTQITYQKEVYLKRNK